MTVRPLIEGENVLIRGRVVEARVLDFIVSIDSHFDGKPTTILVPFTELF
jgi:hypothetical protein